MIPPAASGALRPRVAVEELAAVALIAAALVAVPAQHRLGVDRLAGEVAEFAALEGMAEIPELAAKHGLKLTHSAWLGRDAKINEAEVDALIQAANTYPQAVERVIVGNEVLLRREQPVAALRTLGPWVKQCHMKDAVRTKTPGTWGEEVRLGTGQVDSRPTVPEQVY